MPTPRGVRLIKAFRVWDKLEVIQQTVIESHLLGVFRNIHTKDEICESLAVEVTKVLLRILNGEVINVGPLPKV